MVMALLATIWGRVRTARFIPPLRQSTSYFSTYTMSTENEIEEETLPNYDAMDYYPVRIGEVFSSRYRVIGKLGYGAYSTVWLSQDLQYAPEYHQWKLLTDLGATVTAF